MKRLYKVLEKDLTSPYQRFKYEIGKEYHCHNFDENESNDYSNGFYAVDLDGLPYCFNIHRSIFEVEVWGKQVEFNQFKRRYEYQKITRKVSKKEILKEIKKRNPVDYRLDMVLYPINPLRGQAKKPTDYDLKLLKEWASVGNSVWYSVRASVLDSAGYLVWDSVGDSVWYSAWYSLLDSVGNSLPDSVWYSLRDSVWNSVRAYTGFCFPNIKSWKYIEHEAGIYPFESSVKLWKRGFVPVITNEKLYLCSGENAEIVYEENLKQEK